MRALEGIRVLDLTHALAGPFCTYQLGLLGADVVKIEKPGEGDDFRDFARPPDWDVGPSFVAVNGGKRSVTVNLKSKEGLEVVRKLAETADVVVENQRPGAIEKLGLAYEQLKAINSKLVYCSLSGFGQTGEMARWVAYDHTIQAMVGMSWTGADADVPSQGRGFSVDCFSGYVAHSAILAALVRRGRTGEGQYIDVSMLESAMVLMGVGIVRQILTGDNIKATQPVVHDRPTVGAFRTRDGWIWLSGNFQNHYQALCEVLEAPELLSDPRFATVKTRLAHSAELKAELAKRFATRSAHELEPVLQAKGSPAARVRTTREALDIPLVSDRQMLQPTRTAEGKSIRVMNAGYVTSDGTPGLSGPIPGLGEHTGAVLRELGYSPADIERMRETGAI